MKRLEGQDVAYKLPPFWHVMSTHMANIAIKLTDSTERGRG